MRDDGTERVRAWPTLALVGLMTLTACKQEQAPNAEPKPAPSSPAAATKVDLVAAPAGGTVEAIVQQELARARREGRKLVIYVGADWCEPCQHFHQAAAAGSLDRFFPNLRLLEFDRDRDGDRLDKAGCSSQLIPLFALPDPNGRCSQRRIFGSIKGPGAVANITPRLRALLAKASD